MVYSHYMARFFLLGKHQGWCVKKSLQIGEENKLWEHRIKAKLNTLIFKRNRLRRAF